MLDKGGRVARGTRLVLPRWRAGEAPVLIRWRFWYVEIARSADLIDALLDALPGMFDPLGQLAAVGNAKGTRRTGRQVVFVERLEP